MKESSEPEVPMTKTDVLNLHFLDARHKLLDVAAFLDRVDRAVGPADFRHRALAQSLGILSDGKPDRVTRILQHLSDPTAQPIPAAHTKGAVGAWPRGGGSDR